MKKILLFAAMFALMATGCAKQDNSEWVPGTVQFQITTDAGTRAIYSEEDPVLTNPTVDVFVFDDADAYVKKITLTGVTFEFGKWNTLTGGDILTGGTYTFVAVGWGAGNVFTVAEPPASPASVLATISTSGAASDIYSGTATASVTDDGGRISINITRKVSGVMGYFGNIPSQIDGVDVGYVRLSMSTVNTTLDLADGGIGTVPAAALPFNVIDIDLTGETPTAEGVYPGVNLTGEGVVTLPNSYIDGNFVIPSTPEILDPATPAVDVIFALNICGDDGTVLDTIPVNNGTALPLLPGVLYSLGTKKMAGNTNGGTDMDDTDDDMVIDLETTQELQITITTAWTSTTYLTVE